jgi:methionine synthase II (cobalamin-independent)
MAERILTTHAGSLPQPLALTGLYARSAAGGVVDEAELAAAGKAALTDILARQAESGVDIANNGEQQREAFFLYLRHRLSGLGGRWNRPQRADLVDYPDFAEAMANALDGKIGVSNMEPPKAIGAIAHEKPEACEDECADFDAALKAGGFVLPFANPRHAHEWRVLRNSPPADHQTIAAGVIDTLTNFVEHEVAVANCLETVARALGDPTRLPACTDCGFDTSAGFGRVEPSVVWSKLKSMKAGAEIATERLF